MHISYVTEYWYSNLNQILITKRENKQIFHSCILFQRRKRSALPPNNLDVELLALESNVIEEKEKREGRQSRFGVPKKNGKRRRVVVKRRRQKSRPAVVSRKFIPTTPTPTKTAKVVILKCETMKDSKKKR